MINRNENRLGRFTSSEIYKLCGIGKRKMTDEEKKEHKKNNPSSRAQTIQDESLFLEAGYTYITQKKQERKRKRSLDMNGSSSSTDWGDLMERRVFELIGLEYIDTAKKTYIHPLFPKYWAGSPDLFIPSVKTGDIKGYEPINFCKYADCLLQKDLDLLKSEFPKEYWQIVSNACIMGVSKGEIILYQPYDSEAKAIKELIEEIQDSLIVPNWNYQRIADNIDVGEIYNPFQPDDSDYPNLITWEFDIPEEDKEFITNRVEQAIKLLDETD